MTVGKIRGYSGGNRLCHLCPRVPQANSSDLFDLIEVIYEMSAVMLLIHLSWNVSA